MEELKENVESLGARFANNSDFQLKGLAEIFDGKKKEFRIFNFLFIFFLFLFKTAKLETADNSETTWVFPLGEVQSSSTNAPAIIDLVNGFLKNYSEKDLTSFGIFLIDTTLQSSSVGLELLLQLLVRNNENVLRSLVKHVVSKGKKEESVELLFWLIIQPHFNSNSTLSFNRKLF